MEFDFDKCTERINVCDTTPEQVVALQTEGGWTFDKNAIPVSCPPRPTVLPGVFSRVPPKADMNSLKGSVVVSINKSDGTYGMGGPGWVSFRLERNVPGSSSWQQDKLVFCKWAGRHWITLDGIRLGEEMADQEYKRDLGWVIESAEIEGQCFKLVLRDPNNGKTHVIASLDKVEKNTLGKLDYSSLKLTAQIDEALRMTRCDSELWV